MGSVDPVNGYEYLNDERYTIHRLKPRTEVLTWWIPERYRVREAWLEIDGERVADFEKNPLHLVSYSLPKEIKGTIRQMKDHIHTNPERPSLSR